MEPAASLRGTVPRLALPQLPGSPSPLPPPAPPGGLRMGDARAPALRIGPRVRLFVPSRGWGGRRRREILLAAGAIAVIAHVALIGFILEAPHLWPTPPLHPPPAGLSDPPTIDMVMDDAKYAGGSKQTPPAALTPPAPRTPRAPDSPQTVPSPPVPPDRAPADLPPPPAAPPPPQRQAEAQPEVELDPNDNGLGYGHQDDARNIPASPDDKHANKVPAYPRAAGMRGEEGTVEMLVTIGASGRVSSAEIAVSSGHADLDRTAQRAVLGWHFHPAMRDGVSVPTQSMQVFNFHIDRQ